MSKIPKRNFVKKHMDRIHKPKIHKPKRREKWPHKEWFDYLEEEDNNDEMEHIPERQTPRKEGARC